MKNDLKILLTGFEPFGGEKENPTQIIAEELNGNIILGNKVIGRLLPVSVRRTKSELLKFLNEIKPDILINTGLNGRITDINIERIAINLIDARIPDNDGKQPIDMPIVSNGENAYFSMLPIRKIMEKLHKETIPSRISNSAGTYLCNYVMYLALEYAQRNNHLKKAGFIHVPFMHKQVLNRSNLPSLSIKTIKKAVEIAIIETISD